MKKIISLIVVIISIISLCACSQQKEDQMYLYSSSDSSYDSYSDSSSEIEIQYNDNSSYVSQNSTIQSPSVPQTNVEKHTHSYSKKVVKPSCTNGGYTLYTCKCGNSYKGNITAKLGHSFSAASCKEYGKCSRCGIKGEKGKHDFQNYVCETCRCTDNSAFKLSTPDTSKIYHAEYERNYGLSKYKNTYQIKNIEYTHINNVKIDEKPFNIQVHFTASYIDATSTLLFSGEKYEGQEEFVTIYYSWVYLTDENGTIHRPRGCGYDDAKMTAIKGRDAEFRLYFDNLKAGEYTLNFLEGHENDLNDRWMENGFLK